MDNKKLNSTLETVNLIAKTALQTGVAIGALITIIYCGVIEHYPAGLTIGDVLFFIAASLSFSFIYALVVLALFSAGITLSPILRWIFKGLLLIPVLKNKLHQHTDLSKITFPRLGMDKLPFVFVGLIIFVFIIALYYENFDKALGLTFTVILMSFFYGLWHSESLDAGSPKKNLQLKLGLAVIISITPLIVTKSQGNILNQAMSKVGVRNENVTLQLPEKYVSFLANNDIGTDHNISEGSGMYKNSKILFRGIGDYTVIEIKGFQLTVPNKELLIGRRILAAAID